MPMVGVVPVGLAQVGVHPGDVEAELAGVLRLERADLQLDHHEPGLRPVEEQQVEVEIVAVHGEVVLAADESESVAEFEQEGLQPFGQGGFQVPFGDRAGQVEEVQHVGGRGSAAGPARSLRRPAAR